MPKNTPRQNEEIEKLWRAYEAYIWMMCYAKIPDLRNEFDDIVSETKTALFVAINERRDIKDPKAWILKTGNNIINSTLRKISRKRKRETSLYGQNNELLFDMPYTIDPIEEDIKNRIVDEKYYDVLEELTPYEQELYKMHIKEDKSYTFISGRFRTTESAVKQSTYRLKRKLCIVAHEKAEEMYDEYLKKP